MSGAHASWKDYPENLATDNGQSVWYDLAEHNAEIRHYSKKLFVEDENELAVKVFDYNANCGLHP